MALDTATFITFLKESQPKSWERYEKIYGTDSEKQVIDRFCREVKMVGLLRVLRQGFTDRGVKFRAVFWKPETTINPKTMKVTYDKEDLRYGKIIIMSDADVSNTAYERLFA